MNIIKPKILIVEDDYISTVYLTEILQIYAREILIAKNGTEGLEIFNNHPDTDLILMDLKMTGLNGFEVTKQIRLLNQKVFIIAQTACILDSDRKNAFDAGCNDFISKPVSKKELLVKINKLFPIDI